MNAVRFLTAQHREARSLFARLARLSPRATAARLKLFTRLADLLAVHSALEERFFYPAANIPLLQEHLLTALEEHLAMKRLLTDLLTQDPASPTFRAKLTVLAGIVREHMREEEQHLFPRAARSMSRQALRELGAELEAVSDDLAHLKPRTQVASETARATPLGRRDDVLHPLPAHLHLY